MNEKFGDAGYRIIEPIASGGMGQVFKAEHVITKRIEAVKLLSGAGTEEETDRFLREIQLQASLSHPNIAAVYNAFRLDQDLVMVMELVEGEPLRTMLERGPLAPDLAIHYTCQVLNAIAYAHEHGVIHRDISPSNIVITPQGFVKLMDFGLAKAAASPSASLSGVYLGSPHYMSPEQVKDATRASERSDIYSLGAVLYEMVTGRKVFDGAGSFDVMQAQVERAPTPPIEINPAIPPALSAAILTALEKDPDQRFDDADEFRRALGAPAQAVAPITPPKTKSRRWWLTPALPFVATCAVILLPTAFYVHSRQRPVDAKKPNPPAIILTVPTVPAPDVVAPATPESPTPAPAEQPFFRPTPKRVAQRSPKREPTPAVLGEEPSPAPVKRIEAAHPAAALAPAPRPHVPTEPLAIVPDHPVPEAAPAAAPPAQTQTAEAARDEQAAAAKDKKPHGRFRRALSKIFSPFH
jgi:eukaryotic-like serine/threonine-protein kinase